MQTINHVRIYRVTLHTRHFSFEAYGIDPESAVDSMRDGWKAHSKDYGMAPDDDYIDNHLDDIRIYAVAINTSFRDGEQLTGDTMPIDFEFNNGNLEPVTN